MKGTVAAIIVGAFGLFLIWQGVMDKRTWTSTGKPLFPRWMFVISGLIVLILPVAYLVVNLMM